MSSESARLAAVVIAFSCMSETNKDVVTNAWRTFSTRDPEQIENCFAEDAVWIAPPFDATALTVAKGETTRMNWRQIASFIAKDFGRLFVAGAMTTTIASSSKCATRSHLREYMDTLTGFRQIFGEDAVKPVSALVA